MNYFENNYVLSALAGLAVTIFVYIDRKRNASVNKEPTNFLSYIKIFFAVFSITLGILFYKTKNFTLPIPSKMGGSLGGGAFKTPTHPLVQMRTQVATPQVQQSRVGMESFSNDMTELDLNNVNIGDPRF